MAGWRRCATCRKVLAGEAFDAEGETCRSCLTAPAPKVRPTRASAVKTVRQATAAAERPPLLGIVGSGDLEVRERRAKKSALEQLAQAHEEDFEQLLRVARQAEGLRG